MNKVELNSKTGFVAVQQKVRDAMGWLSQTFKYQGETSESGLTGKKIYDHFTDPLKVAEFEEGDFSWMEGYSDSQRKVYNIQKKLIDFTSFFFKIKIFSQHSASINIHIVY